MPEVHAVDGRNQRGRHEGNGRHGKNLDHVVLLDGHDAEHGVEQELDLVGKIGGVVG